MARSYLCFYFANKMRSFDSTTYFKQKDINELIHIFRYEVQNAQRPANEVILDDEDVMRILKISKRKLQYMKADRIIPYHTFDSNSPRTYYLLIDILGILKRNRTEPINSNTLI